MASRTLYEPLLARMPQDAVTQRLCAAWFELFPLETVLNLHEATPEVFDFLIAGCVRVELRERRKYLIIAHGIGFLIGIVTAWDIASGDWAFLLFTLPGWFSVFNLLRKLTPERCIPPFILRIGKVQVTAEPKA